MTENKNKEKEIPVDFVENSQQLSYQKRQKDKRRS
jgi:hypothetical protein